MHKGLVNSSIDLIMTERKPQTINGVPIPDGVTAIAPEGVAEVAKYCQDQGVPFLFIGGVASHFETDQDKERRQVAEFVDSRSTPLIPEDRKRIIDQVVAGFDEVFLDFMEACQEERWPEAKKMIEEKKVQTGKLHYGWDVVHMLARYGGGPMLQEGKENILEWLLKRSGLKVDINVRSCTGKTPLHYAVSNYHVDVVRLLLESKADPSARDHAGLLAASCFAPFQDVRVELMPKELIAVCKPMAQLLHDSKLLSSADATSQKVAKFVLSATR